MKSENIGYLTELDSDFSKDLKKVSNADEFGDFLQRYFYWLDEESKSLNSLCWKRLKPLIEDCRNPKSIPEEKHAEALTLMMPNKIMQISIRAHQFKVPWGAMYLRMKELKLIDY